MNFDVFNGDADGICALLQLRLTDPRDATLVTGIKRDIALLSRVAAVPGDHITVLDISMAKNQQPLRRLLDSDVTVDYVDHHAPGDIPKHRGLTVTISEASEVCTALLMNGRLLGAQVAWAVVGAFGDNLDEPALKLGAKSAMSTEELRALRELGVCINYNGYGTEIEDLHFHPAKLYEKLYEAANPQVFLRSDDFATLRDGYNSDIAASGSLTPLVVEQSFSAYQLPDKPWARRVSGVFSNQLVRASPDRAHAVMTERGDGAFLVSVRAPFNHRVGADRVCSNFETGGGRAAAAGINRLPASDVELLFAALAAEYGDQS